MAGHTLQEKFNSFVRPMPDWFLLAGRAVLLLCTDCGNFESQTALLSGLTELKAACKAVSKSCPKTPGDESHSGITLKSGFIALIKKKEFHCNDRTSK